MNDGIDNGRQNGTNRPTLGRNEGIAAASNDKEPPGMSPLNLRGQKMFSESKKVTGTRTVTPLVRPNE